MASTQQIVETYYGEVERILRKIRDEEGESIDRAAQLIADRIEEDELIYLGNGGGHSSMGLEELFYRAGGLACINPMLDGGINLTHGAIRSTKMERTAGYGRTVIDIYGIDKGDVVMIITAVGTTTMAIDEALECKDRGAKIIAITSTSFAENIPPGHPSRHPSSKNLHELADIFVNCHVPMGDAVLELEGIEQKFAPVSTIALTFAEEAIVARVVEILVERGIEPPIWRSANTPGGDEANQKYIEKYGPRVKLLS